ncbi:X-ray repair cross-complementing protein 5 [Oxyura jamaicensis]|uniref:X-ray repair cross-complementing protein 5 n=1 Tax=Oxyura jamaicensis TaxID=8884 RepID=UPI0015A54D30|nr:X-ray repair cross-complementing protein 5 [Oxyura jamaicensis]XP_035167049.1 X-ray repair cross-complementing protein 5 [Oxyura jamaicensis]
MSDWVSYYRAERPGDDDEEREEGDGHEEGTEPAGEYRFSGRDSLIFLVDASQAMFQPYQDEEAATPFDMTMQCIRNVYTSKIISSDRDLLSVVFYGTQTNKNSADFKHIYVLQDLDNPGAKRVLELDQYRGEEGQALFRETFGHNADYSLGEALWACSNLFSDVRVRLSHKRIMLFTNEDNPHANDSAKAKLARTRAGDLRDTGIILDLLHLKKPGGFDISLFYRDIINVAEDEDLGIQPDESGKLEHLMKKVRAKEARKRTLVRLNLYLNKDLSLSVGVYNLIQKAYKPYPVKLYRETNEPVKTKTRVFNGKTGSLLLPSDTKRAQVYGNRQIVLEKEETEELKRFDSPGLFLIGFKPLSMLKQHHHIKPAQFIYPEESLISGSTTLFNALLIKCLEREVMALCRYTIRRNTPPRFVALVPQEEEVDEQKVQIAPPGFHVIFLPYADDKRNVDYTEKVPASQEQVNKMKEIIQKLRFKYRTDSFENPVLQQHFRNLEALALDMMEPEEAKDLTMPKSEEMSRRLGNLVEEFKQLVYPPDYNPDGKAAKRKQACDDQADKRPKIEISEDSLRSYVQAGTLGKLTVPALKDVCRLYGLRSGGKKQELIDALTEYFNKH